MINLISNIYKQPISWCFRKGHGIPKIFWANIEKVKANRNGICVCSTMTSHSEGVVDEEGFQPVRSRTKKKT